MQIIYLHNDSKEQAVRQISLLLFKAGLKMPQSPPVADGPPAGGINITTDNSTKELYCEQLAPLNNG